MEKEENLYTPNCIRTYTGKYIDVFNPKVEDIDIRDIAHGLSCVPRFAGHLPNMRTVAEHSMRCAMNCSEDMHRLAALLHDASEAYLGDLPSPIKQRMPEYKRVEDGLMRVIALKFGFQYPLAQPVHIVDRYELEWEWYNLMLISKLFAFMERSIWNRQKAIEKRFLRAFNHYNSVTYAGFSASTNEGKVSAIQQKERGGNLYIGRNVTRY